MRVHIKRKGVKFPNFNVCNFTPENLVVPLGAGNVDTSCKQTQKMKKNVAYPLRKENSKKKN